MVLQLEAGLGEPGVPLHHHWDAQEQQHAVLQLGTGPAWGLCLV